MAREVFLHIGLDKTGSSSIQHTLFTQKIPGLTYLHMGVQNPSQQLAVLFEPDFGRAGRALENDKAAPCDQKRFQ